MNLASNVTLIRPDVYKAARRVIYTAENDWPKMLGAAETLAQSPDHTDTALARQVRKAYSLHLQKKIEDAAKREDQDEAARLALARKKLGLFTVIYMLVLALIVLAAGLGWALW